MALQARAQQAWHLQQHRCGSRARAARFVPFAAATVDRAANGPTNRQQSWPAAQWAARQLSSSSHPVQQRQRPGRASWRAPASANDTGELSLPDGSVSVVLLAGGVGKRMGAAIPKQYLELRGQAIATYSLQTFGAMPQVGEVVIVCDPSWRHVFEERLPGLPPSVDVKWALPGAERQDSVSNGLQQVRDGAVVVAVHDSARPLVSAADSLACMLDGLAVGAAVLGVPVKPTIKEVAEDMSVVKTLERSRLWEVQTPQCIRPELLREGFRLVREKGLEVTDDVSIIEAMGLPVKITRGSYTNIKVTTPDDMSVAEKFLSEAGQAPQQGGKAAAAAAAVPEVQRTW